jgi:hypothetical protein
MKIVALAVVAAAAASLACNTTAPPSGVASDRSPARTASVSVRDLPVERASNVFFARVSLNGKGPFWFTVDTGATLTVIDTATATSLRVPVEDEGKHRNVGVASGLTEMRVARGVTITAGDAPPFSPDRLFVVPVRANAGALGHHIDGVLGTDFLRRFVVEFDYPAGRVRLHAPSRFAYRGEGAVVPISVEGNVLLARAGVALADNRTLTAQMLIDTGSSARLSFNSPFVRRHKLSRFPTLGLTASVGINGVTAAPVIGLRSLSFGQAVVDRPEVALSQSSSGLNASDDFDGIISAELLSRFRLFVDYPAGRLILER